MNDENHQPRGGDVTVAASECPQRRSLTEAQAAEQTRERLRRLPPEVGVVLLSAGVAGLILPGPIGTPLVLAGGLVLAPRTFNRLERWVQRRFPNIHQHGRRHLDRFIDDFQRRYPAGQG
jgi:hypothetical protein